MKDGFIIIGFSLVALVVGAYLVLHGRGAFPNTDSAMSSNRSSAAVMVPFTPLAKGTYTNISTRTNYLITSKVQLEELWKLVTATSTPPAVDFSRNYVAAVFAGDEPTSGYGVTVARVQDAHERMVTVVLTSPGSGCAITKSPTRPYQIVELPRSSLPVTHQYEMATTSCTR